MAVTAANTNPYFASYVNSSSNVKGVDKSSHSNTRNEEKPYLKYSTIDERNEKVTEKPESNKTIHDYSIPLQQNTPAAKLLNILKSFNEKQKTVDRKSEEDYADFTEITDESEAKPLSPDEIGYYVVLDERNPAPAEKKISKPLELWRKRISDTYHLGFLKEPGTLVNVVV